MLHSGRFPELLGTNVEYAVEYITQFFAFLTPVPIEAGNETQMRFTDKTIYLKYNAARKIVEMPVVSGVAANTFPELLGTGVKYAAEYLRQYFPALTPVPVRAGTVPTLAYDPLRVYLEYDTMWDIAHVPHIG